MSDWLTLSQTAGTSGTTTINLTAITNSADERRTQGYRVRTSDESVNVIVLQKGIAKTIFLNPSVVYIHSTGSTSVEVITDYGWTATTTDTAVTLSQMTGSGTTTINVGYSDQTHVEPTKTAVVVFSTDSESAILTVNHTLSGGFFTAYYNVDPDYLEVQLWEANGAEPYQDGLIYYAVESISVDDGPWIDIYDVEGRVDARFYTFSTSGIHKVDFRMRTPYIPSGFYAKQTLYPWQDPPSQYPVVEVITREGITSIGNPSNQYNSGVYGAFQDNYTLEKITMGNDLTVICCGSFANALAHDDPLASHLSSVTFSTNLQSINLNAFSNTICLERVTFPDSITRMEDMAFYQSALKEVEFSKNSELTFMGVSCFSNINILTNKGGLQSVVIPQGITSLIDSQFVQTYTPNGAPETRNDIETIYAYPPVPPVLYEERPHQTNYHAFEGALAPTGTVYYPSGADYSLWINDTHFANWTFVADL